MDRSERIWAAGFLSGKGHIAFVGTSYVHLTIGMVDEDTIRRFHEIVGVGTIYARDRSDQGHQTFYRWVAAHKLDVRHVLMSTLPWLEGQRKEKAKQALVRLARVRTVGHNGRCSRGHPMKSINLYVSPKGRRQCRMCLRRRDRKRARTDK